MLKIKLTQGVVRLLRALRRLEMKTETAVLFVALSLVCSSLLAFLVRELPRYDQPVITYIGDETAPPGVVTRYVGTVVVNGGEEHLRAIGVLGDSPEKAQDVYPINLNTASSERLELLEGIGPVLAGRIIAYREKSGRFRKIEDLLNVSGVGEKTLENIRPYVTLRD